MKKFVCDSCGSREAKVRMFSYFIDIESADDYGKEYINNDDYDSNTNRYEDDLCDRCENEMKMFLITAKPWLNTDGTFKDESRYEDESRL